MNSDLWCDPKITGFQYNVLLRYNSFNKKKHLESTKVRIKIWCPVTGIEAARHHEYQGLTGHVAHRWHTLIAKTGIISGMSKFKF